MKQYESLKLKNQLCFPLYSASNEIIKKYRPYLSELGLTYLQYVTMMAFWEYKQMTMEELSKILYLDIATLTPVLNSLATKGFIKKTAFLNDFYILEMKLTEQGEQLKEEAVKIPEIMKKCLVLTDQEAKLLYQLLYKILQ